MQELHADATLSTEMDAAFNMEKEFMMQLRFKNPSYDRLLRATLILVLLITM